MLFYCETCLVSSDSKMKTINDWTVHLLSHDHQLNTKKAFLNSSYEQNEKTWIIMSKKPGSKLSKSLTLERLVLHFSQFGFLADVYIDNGAWFAVVQIDLLEVLRTELPPLIPGEHTINENIVMLRRKMDVSDQDWFSMVGIVPAEDITGDPTPNRLSAASQIQILTRETKKSKNQNEQRDLPPRFRCQPLSKDKSKYRDDHRVTSSPLSSSSTSIPRCPVPPKSLVTESLTFYNKNVQNPSPGSGSAAAKVDRNEKQKNKIDNREQIQKTQKQMPDKLKGNSNIRAVLNGSNHNQYVVTSPHQKLPECTDYYNLFADLTRIPMQARSGNKHVTTFQKLHLDYQLLCFMYSVTMTHEDWFKRKQLLQELAELLGKRFPKSLLYPFGSMSSGLGDHFSDIDIYVDIYGETSGIHVNPYEGRRSSKQEIMMEIRKILKTAKYPPPVNRSIYGKIIPVLSARVPILKLLHLSTKINIDLSFENLLSFQNTKMITFIMTLDECVKPLLLLVRYWGKFHGLTGSTLIKNYAFILLVLVFLSHKKIIPTVHHLQSLIEAPYYIDGWNAGFCENRAAVLSSFEKVSPCDILPSGLPTTRSILLLAQEFFHTCAHTDFSASMVCSLTSQLIPKANFSPGNEEGLPETLERYKSWSSRQSVGHRLNISTPFVLQDPFLLSFNVGGVTTEGTLLKFQVACAQTAEILRQNLKSIVDLFVPLPPQVGEKKFMAMQRIHKRHEQLKQEVKEALGYKCTSPDSSRETGPIHLLPLEQIISKKTIQYGQGWEMFLHYSLGDSSSKSFQQLFNRELKCLLLNQLIREVDLENKMKALWITFVKEFMMEVWVPCFGIAHTLEEVSNLMRQFTDSIINGRGRQGRRKPKADDSDLEDVDGNGQLETESQKLISNEQVDEEDTKATEKNEQERNHLLAKLNCITELEHSVRYYRYKCTADTPFWPRREHYRKQAVKNLSSSSSHSGHHDYLPDSPLSSKEKKRSKGRASKKDREKFLLSKCMVDPLAIEQKTMELILGGEPQDSETAAKSTSGTKIVFQCNCWVKLDSSYLDDWPEIFLIFEKDPAAFTQNYGAGGAEITKTMRKLFPDYMLFKLMQWFAVEGASDTESTKMGTDLRQTSFVFTFSDSENEEQNGADNCDNDESDDMKTPSPISFHDGSEED